MSSQKNFAVTPSVSISRSKFKRPSQHKTSFNLGQIVPIYCDADILPGDTVSIDLAALVRMSTPVAPIMDNIFIDYYAFYAPNRILWKNWKTFMGENVTTAGPVLTEPSFPVAPINDANNVYAQVVKNSLGDYLGLPVGLSTSGGANQVLVSRLPGMMYFVCYNEWFRDQNLISPFLVNTDNDGKSYLAQLGSSYFGYGSSLLKAAKDSDYFTRALPFAQKGAPVTLPLGNLAEVKAYKGSGYPNAGYAEDGVWTPAVVATTGQVTITDYHSQNAILAADLSNATAASINQLRFAFQYQKFLEKDALYGSRYWEVLKGHFGITAPDSSLQRPELLGHFRQHINIDQVLQTSETSTTALGTPGANSVSGKSDHLISKSFVEHGCLMIVAIARHEQTYGQGVNRMWSRTHRTDFYWPVFANLGAQEIKTKEIFAVGNSNTVNENVFGYQEAWAEYRYKPSIVTADLNPAVSSTLNFWTLANAFGSAPTLSQSFIEQDRNNIGRALVTSSTGPDFIADFYFDATYVRPMPMYSIPGLIDHH